MQLNGTTKSLVANHLAESIAGSMTIRAFEEEDRFFVKNLDLIDICRGLRHKGKEEEKDLLEWPCPMPDAPLVLHGISCTFEGGHKIDIVGRTGSGKTTLIGASQY
ncbi:hypothetical protein CsSME_00022531 [Camellia sinensis var. sinensis]